MSLISGAEIPEQRGGDFSFVTFEKEPPASSNEMELFSKPFLQLSLKCLDGLVHRLWRLENVPR